MTEAAVAPPAAIVGRSLWGDAWARLKANRAAMVSLCYLVLMAIVCVVGPWFVPHNYTTIYSDYVRTLPSFSAYPKAEMVQGALDDVLKRMRVDLKDWKLEDSRAVVTVTATRPIDERYLRYIDRSDTFDDAKVVQAMLKGQTMVVKGTPAKGDAATDTYSLNGISKAYQELNKACGVKS